MKIQSFKVEKLNNFGLGVMVAQSCSTYFTCERHNNFCTSIVILSRISLWSSTPQIYSRHNYPKRSNSNASGYFMYISIDSAACYLSSPHVSSCAEYICDTDHEMSTHVTKCMSLVFLFIALMRDFIYLSVKHEWIHLRKSVCLALLPRFFFFFLYTKKDFRIAY